MDEFFKMVIRPAIQAVMPTIIDKVLNIAKNIPPPNDSELSFFLFSKYTVREIPNIENNQGNNAIAQ